MIDEYKLITKHTIRYQHLNVYGYLFGGVMLSWLDESGYIFARDITGTDELVTVYVNEIKFNQPGHLGDIICIYGKLKKTGNTSVTIKLNAVKSEPDKKKEKIITQCEMVFVRIDKKGKPFPLCRCVSGKK